MSFGSQDGRSHPRVRRFGGNLFGSKWCLNIDESAEDTVVLLSQFGGIGFRFLIKSELLMSALKASRPNILSNKTVISYVSGPGDYSSSFLSETEAKGYDALCASLPHTGSCGNITVH